MKLRMPAEHGAWGILLVPMVCAAALADAWNVPLALSLACAVSLFLLRGSLEAHRDWRALRSAGHVLLAVVSGATAGMLLFSYQRYELLAMGAVATALFLLHTWLLRRHEETGEEKRSLAAELVGVLLLTLGAPVVWIGARGRLDAAGARVWLLNGLFFLGGVLYVKYRVRGVLAHREFSGIGARLAFAWPVFVYHVLLVLFLVSWTLRDAISAAVLLAFAPGVLRTAGLAAHLGRRFPIRRLGWTEIAHAAVFAALLVLALRGIG
jgi:hypothetical protein